jgi:opacity protein-like surface antigen
MRKVISVLCLVLSSGIFVFGQTTDDDYKKVEVFAGYSNGQVDTGINSEDSFENFFDDRLSFHGFNASATFNVNRYVGITGDVSGTYRKDDFSFAVSPTETLSFKTRSSLYNVLGGVQIKDNASTARVKPFGYALVGAGIGKAEVSSVVCPTGVDCSGFESGSETGLAGAFGGGIDIKINDRVDFRAVKFDYNPIRFDGRFQHNFRIGIGFVFR